MPRLFFGLFLSVSALLLALVFLAPFLDNGQSKVLALFAHDATVRRTAIASGLGLGVTAWIFFRSSPGRLLPARSKSKPPRQPPPSIAGA